MQREQEKFSGQVAVVTGAGSGIGRALAERLASAGSRLALSDIDTAGLDETVARCRAKGAEVEPTVLDVACRDAVFAHADATEARFGQVNLVINNAGVALDGHIRDLSIEDMEWLININMWGVVYGTKAFLPHLERATWGHVVNISSVFGIIAVPGQAAYNMAKFAVRGFTECLRQELELSDLNVSATSVHPGGVRTNIAKSARSQRDAASRAKLTARFDRAARTEPDSAAKQILAGVIADAPRVLVGLDAHLIDGIQRLAPTAYRNLTKRLSR